MIIKTAEYKCDLCGRTLDSKKEIKRGKYVKNLQLNFMEWMLGTNLTSYHFCKGCFDDLYEFVENHRTWVKLK